ncbi:MAG: prolipoprotein diacylglyceryl transferase family protein [Balneolaceae bacterium]|nr:prolipoprotein diacylglyceryl transferase family protein [Balneolaceae bacterium]
MYETLFEFSISGVPYSVSSYKFFGVAGGLYFLYKLLGILKQNDISRYHRWFISGIIGVSFIIGSRILYAAFFLERTLLDPSIIYKFALSNFSLFGGLYLSLFTLWGISKWQQLPFLKTSDKLIPHVAVTLIFLRTGCFLNGCCYGKETDMPWGVVFPRDSFVHRAQITENPLSYFASVQAVHPTQIYEILVIILSITIAWIVFERIKLAGLKTSVFVISFTVGRFIIYYFRDFQSSAESSIAHHLQAPLLYSITIFIFSYFTYVKLKENEKLPRNFKFK